MSKGIYSKIAQMLRCSIGIFTTTIMTNNNEAFFETLEQLIREHGITIDRPKGSAHPRFPDLIYPINYGYINNTQSQDGDGIDVFLGDDESAEVVGIICTVDTVKRDSEVKVLYKCTEENIQTAVRIMNNGPMRGILVRRLSGSNS